MPLGALAERPRDLVAAEVAQRLVQVVVEDVEAVVVGGLARGVLAADDRLQPGKVLVAGAQRGAADRRRIRAPRARTARRSPPISLIRVTNVPSCGTISTSRSSRSRCSASRIGRAADAQQLRPARSRRAGGRARGWRTRSRRAARDTPARGPGRGGSGWQGEAAPPCLGYLHTSARVSRRSRRSGGRTRARRTSTALGQGSEGADQRGWAGAGNTRIPCTSSPNRGGWGCLVAHDPRLSSPSHARNPPRHSAPSFDAAVDVRRGDASLN